MDSLKPPFKLARMGHVALQVDDLGRSLRFYKGLGLKASWEGDEDWANLSLGGDDLSLVRKQAAVHPPHVGLKTETREDLDEMHAWLRQQGFSPEPIHDHRDGTVSFYFKDPDGNQLEALWDPRKL